MTRSLQVWGMAYPSKDADMKGAEEDYLELEKELDKQIRQMESTHPGYDEYRYQLDEIGHDPYQLISHLTAVYEQFTRGQVKPVIKELFKQKFFENGTAERAKESGTEQNYNMIDGCVNNVPKKPRRIGGRWSVLDRLHIKQAERRQKDNAPQQEQERSRKS